METIQSFWTSLGWLSNAVTILLGIATIVGLYKGIALWLKLKSSEFKPFGDMQSFIESKINESENIKSKTVVVVDDQPENYPLDYLRKCGFNITPITKISFTNYKHLLDYDLIILDVTNIVEEDMNRGGLELMKKIKKDNSRKPVIAASSKKYDPTLTEFFRLSDGQISTPIKDQALEKVVTNILLKFYSPKTQAKQIDDFLTGKGLDQKQKAKSLKLGYQFINKSIDQTAFINSCAKISHKIDTHKYSSMLNHLRDTL